MCSIDISVPSHDDTVTSVYGSQSGWMKRQLIPSYSLFKSKSLAEKIGQWCYKDNKVSTRQARSFSLFQEQSWIISSTDKRQVEIVQWLLSPFLTADHIRHSNWYLVCGPSDASYLLHPAAWFGCGVIGQDWAGGGSDWTAIRKGKGNPGNGERRKGGGGEWFYFNNNKQTQTANVFYTGCHKGFCNYTQKATKS